MNATEARNCMQGIKSRWLLVGSGSKFLERVQRPRWYRPTDRPTRCHMTEQSELNVIKKKRQRTRRDSKRQLHKDIISKESSFGFISSERAIKRRREKEKKPSAYFSPPPRKQSLIEINGGRRKARWRNKEYYSAFLPLLRRWKAPFTRKLLSSFLFSFFLLAG